MVLTLIDDLLNAASKLPSPHLADNIVLTVNISLILRLLNLEQLGDSRGFHRVHPFCGVWGKWENLGVDADCWLPDCRVRVLHTGENGSSGKPQYSSSKTDAVRPGPYTPGIGS